MHKNLDLHYSIKAAKKVLALLKPNHKVYVTHLSNGREQGYFLQSSIYNDYSDSLCCTVAQQRNSDDLVVCYGNVTDFDDGTHVPTEYCYQNSRIYFHFNQQQQCADFIQNFLENGTDKKPEQVPLEIKDTDTDTDKELKHTLNELRRNMDILEATNEMDKNEQNLLDTIPTQKYRN